MLEVPRIGLQWSLLSLRVVTNNFRLSDGSDITVRQRAQASYTSCLSIQASRHVAVTAGMNSVMLFWSPRDRARTRWKAIVFRTCRKKKRVCGGLQAWATESDSLTPGRAWEDTLDHAGRVRLHYRAGPLSITGKAIEFERPSSC